MKCKGTSLNSSLSLDTFTHTTVYCDDLFRVRRTSQSLARSLAALQRARDEDQQISDNQVATDYTRDVGIKTHLGLTNYIFETLTGHRPLSRSLYTQGFMYGFHHLLIGHTRDYRSNATVDTHLAQGVTASFLDGVLYPSRLQEDGESNSHGKDRSS
jgi:hypothetical protein